MRILGIDPSLHSTGYGVVECGGSTMRLVEGGIISPRRDANFPERLAELQQTLSDIITAFRPDAMVIEEVFARSAYPRTAIMMAHARGALVCAAVFENVPVFNYAATAVKRALVGNGSASKQQVASMVVQTLRLKRLPSPPDVTDALALAIAHARRTNGRTLVGRNGKAI